MPERDPDIRVTPWLGIVVHDTPTCRPESPRSPERTGCASPVSSFTFTSEENVEPLSVVMTQVIRHASVDFTDSSRVVDRYRPRQSMT
jgi:hypothetical protein